MVPLERRVWQTVLLVAALHLIVAASYTCTLSVWPKNKKSEITIELAGSIPRGEDGLGERLGGASPPLSKNKVRDAAKQTRKQTKETSNTTSASSAGTVSASAGPETAPVVDADYKAAYLNNPKPPYPPVAFQMRIEGTVILNAHVQPDGSCREVILSRSSGNDMLDHSALSTVSHWKFTPAKSQGKDIAQWVKIPITFSIKHRS